MFSNLVFDMLHICKAQGALQPEKQNSLGCFPLRVLLDIPAVIIFSEQERATWWQEGKVQHVRCVKAVLS